MFSVIFRSWNIKNKKDISNNIILGVKWSISIRNFNRILIPIANKYFWYDISMKNSEKKYFDDFGKKAVIEYNE